MRKLIIFILVIFLLMSVSPNIGIAINTNVTIAGEDGISKDYTIILGEEGVLNETLYPKEYVLFTFLRSYTNDIDLLLYWNGFNRFSYLDIQEFISNNDPPEDMDPSDYLRLYVKWNILSKLPPKSMLLMTSHFNSMEYLIYRFRNEIDTTGVRDIPEEWANPDYTSILTAQEVGDFMRNWIKDKLPALVILYGCESLRRDGVNTWRWAFRFTKTYDFPDYWLDRGIIGSVTVLHLPHTTESITFDFIKTLLRYMVKSGYNVVEAAEKAYSDVTAKYNPRYSLGVQIHWIDEQGDYTYYLNNSVTDELILIITDRYLTFDPDLDDLAREYSIRWFNKYFRNIFPAFHDYILRKGLLNPEIFDKVRLGSTLSYNIKLSDKPLSIFIWLDYINGEFTISSVSISIDSIDETLKSLVEIYTANNFSLVKEFFNEIIHNITLDNIGIRLNSHRTIYVPDLTGKEVYRFYRENFNYIFYNVFTNKSLAYLISDNVTKPFETVYLPPKPLSLDFTIYFSKGKDGNSSTLMFDVHGLSNYVVLKDMEELLSEIRWNIDFEEAIDIIHDNTSLDEDYIRSHIESYEVLFNNSLRPIYFVKKSTNIGEYYSVYVHAILFADTGKLIVERVKVPLAGSLGSNTSLPENDYGIGNDTSDSVNQIPSMSSTTPTIQSSPHTNIFNTTNVADKFNTVGKEMPINMDYMYIILITVIAIIMVVLVKHYYKAFYK